MKVLYTLFIVTSFGLVSCTQSRVHTFYTSCPGHNSYQYGDYQIYSNPEYRQYSDYQENQNGYHELRGVYVPDSYHAGGYRNPQKPQSRDNSWVRSQNPQGYTIQLSEGRKASAVARSLTQAPKRNRTATVKSYSGDAAYFRGVYGSYGSYDAAKQAMDSLPANIRSQAKIKRWGSVQN